MAGDILLAGGIIWAGGILRVGCIFWANSSILGAGVYSSVMVYSCDILWAEDKLLNWV